MRESSKVQTQSMTIFENQFREDGEYPVKNMQVIQPVLKRPQRFDYQKPSPKKTEEQDKQQKPKWKAPTQFKEFQVGKRNLVIDHQHNCGESLDQAQIQLCTF